MNEDDRLVQSQNNVSLNVEVASTSPQVYIVKNFLSEYETNS